MDICVIVPKVVRNYRAEFPEATRNAYPYFNYDNRVVDESVDRHDEKRSYQGPDDLTDAQYDALVSYARQLVNPMLAKYSFVVACEDALSTAIRHFQTGLFDGKVNADRYNVLLKAMAQPRIAKKKEKKEKPKEVKFHTLRELGIKPSEVPKRERIRERIHKDVPRIIREKGKAIIKKD